MLNLKEIREEIIKKYIGDSLISELTEELKNILITDLQSNPFKSNIELSIILENILIDSKVNLKMGWERILINYILKDLFELNYEINKSCNEPLMFRVIISIDSYDA